MDDHRDERETLLSELEALQEALEASFQLAAVEPMLSLQLTMQQLKVLTILVTEPEGSTVQALAKTLGVSLATMSGIVDRLESNAMVDRTLDPNDNRVRRVIATRSGSQAVRALLAGRPELSRTPLSLLAIEDLRALAQGIRAVLKVMTEGSRD